MICLQKYYSYREVIDAKIYDSTGLYFGDLCGFSINEKPLLKACLKFNVGDMVPDINRLKGLLEERGLEIPQDLTLEELVLTARNEGLEIPMKKVVSKVEFVKAFIDLDDVLLIDVVYRRVYRGNSRIAVILLKSPREAKYRGLPLPINNPYIELIDKTIGKLVVSTSNGIIGYVSEVVFSPGKVGLRIESENYRSGVILWNNFLSILETRGFSELGNLLRNNIGEHERLDLHLYGYIYHLLETYKAPSQVFELLNSNLEFEELLVEKYQDIEWDNILKIGDIIIAK